MNRKEYLMHKITDDVISESYVIQLNVTTVKPARSNPKLIDLTDLDSADESVRFCRPQRASLEFMAYSPVTTVYGGRAVDLSIKVYNWDGVNESSKVYLANEASKILYATSRMLSHKGKPANIVTFPTKDLQHRYVGFDISANKELPPTFVLQMSVFLSDLKSAPVGDLLSSDNKLKAIMSLYEGMSWIGIDHDTNVIKIATYERFANSFDEFAPKDIVTNIFGAVLPKGATCPQLNGVLPTNFHLSEAVKRSDMLVGNITLADGLSIIAENGDVRKYTFDNQWIYENDAPQPLYLTKVVSRSLADFTDPLFDGVPLVAGVSAANYPVITTSSDNEFNAIVYMANASAATGVMTSPMTPDGAVTSTTQVTYDGVRVPSPSGSLMPTGYTSAHNQTVVELLSLNLISPSKREYTVLSFETKDTPDVPRVVKFIIDYQSNNIPIMPTHMSANVPGGPPVHAPVVEVTPNVYEVDFKVTADRASFLTNIAPLYITHLIALSAPAINIPADYSDGLFKTFTFDTRNNSPAATARATVKVKFTVI